MENSQKPWENLNCGFFYGFSTSICKFEGGDLVGFFGITICFAVIIHAKFDNLPEIGIYMKISGWW